MAVSGEGRASRGASGVVQALRPPNAERQIRAAAVLGLLAEGLLRILDPDTQVEAAASFTEIPVAAWPAVTVTVTGLPFHWQGSRYRSPATWTHSE